MGTVLGDCDGHTVGALLGDEVGDSVGTLLGDKVGDADGAVLGDKVGGSVGSLVLVVWREFFANLLSADLKNGLSHVFPGPPCKFEKFSKFAIFQICNAIF